MRQRGPTATALSPSLYLDKHSSRPITPEASGLINDTNTGDLQSGMFPNSTTSSISELPPVLSHMNSTHSINCFVNAQKIDPQDYLSNSSTLLPDLSCTDINKVSGYVNHRKIRKNTKLEPKHHLNGNSSQNVQSLKVTIRRTYKSNKTDSGVCTIVNTPNNHPMESSGDIHSSSHPFHSVHSTNGIQLNPPTIGLSTDSLCSNETISQTNIKRVVDKATCTTESATLTEPDLLEPCEPGTKVVVEGVVWLETSGILVLSIQWRGRNYTGTLLDAPKQTFAPSCMDKGIASALSLLRGRKPWPYGSPGAYRTRGVHHYHHHCRPYHHHRRGGFVFGGPMTTRSAAAAAAASSTLDSASLKDMDSVSPTLSNEHNFCSDGHPDDSEDNKTQSGASNHTTTNNNSSNNNNYSAAHRGAKGRRRRGAGRRPGRPASAVSPVVENSLDLQASELKYSGSDDASMDPEINCEEVSVADPSLNCPFLGCQKCFSDMLSMRYHLTLGHSSQANVPDVSVNLVSQVAVRDANMIQSDNTNVDPDDSMNISVCDNSAASSPPPKLARAHSTKDRSNDSNDNSLTIINTDDIDDNIAPPKLHRIVSIPDSFPTATQTEADSNPSKCSTLNQPDVPDEPPAPSPAYSDISDDGTVLSETNVPMLEVSHAQLPNPTFSGAPLISNRNDPMINPRNCLDLPTGLNLSPMIIRSSNPSVVETKDFPKIYLTTGMFPANLKSVSNLVYQAAPSISSSDLHSGEIKISSNGETSVMDCNGNGKQVSYSLTQIPLEKWNEKGVSFHASSNVNNNSSYSDQFNMASKGSNSLQHRRPFNNISLVHASKANASKSLVFPSVLPEVSTIHNGQVARPSSAGPFIPTSSFSHATGKSKLINELPLSTGASSFAKLFIQTSKPCE